MSKGRVIFKKIWESEQQRIIPVIQEKIYNLYCEHAKNIGKIKPREHRVYLNFEELVNSPIFLNFEAYTSFLSPNIFLNLMEYRHIKKNCLTIMTWCFLKMHQLEHRIENPLFMDCSTRVKLLRHLTKMENGKMVTSELKTPKANDIKESHLRHGICFGIRFMFADMSVLLIEIPWEEKYESR